MHPNNLHNAPYNFEALCKTHPPLQGFVHINSFGKETINFSAAEAVLHLNKALLKHHYQIADWNIPEGYLYPPIPSRADYLFYLNDLLQENKPLQPIKVLDVGTGANCIYALLAAQLFDWEITGCDIDAIAVTAAQQNILATKGLSEKIEIRHQTNNADIFKGIILPGEFYHATICNPPFYASEKDANKSTLRKLKKLNPNTSVLELERNFKGRPNELWCNGGEALFIKRMVKQSVAFKKQVGWFTTLVSKSETLLTLYKLLIKVGATYETLEMQHGNKITRVVAWRFV
ncbi:23S rRNA (adenine(1618)-N(6))-methyltransferase RlmF [Rasiella sp. SM2506]|uniref:23S rRNA (adenine(1618)-N(6))-methyltransferase RlmF n=1 Tax=Rasiella sp. SM2506 TaxID=3423914 RepID=UPI003D7BF912